MLVAEIHEMLRKRLAGKISIDELTSEIEEEQIIMKRDVFEQLNEAYIFVHEKYFTLYSSDGTIDLCRDHTDYEIYHKSYRFRTSAFRDEELYKEDTEKLLDEGYKKFAGYHPHPISKNLVQFQRTIFSQEAMKGSKRIKYRQNYPSIGDLEYCVSTESENNFMFIGHKFDLEKRLNVKAFVPVAICSWYEHPQYKTVPSAYSALKQVSKNWMSDTRINNEEFKKYARLLSPIIIESTLHTKRDCKFEVSQFIEIPVKIQ